MLAAKRNYTAALIMVFTQLPALLVYHKYGGGGARVLLELAGSFAGSRTRAWVAALRLPPAGARPALHRRAVPCHQAGLAPANGPARSSPSPSRRKVVLSVGHFARHLPLQAALHAPRAAVDPAAYVPPPLRRRAVGWEPEWGKVWSWYGIGRYSL